MDLYNAARKGKASRVRQLLQRGESPNEKKEDNWNWKSLPAAASMGHSEVVGDLIAANANSNVSFETGDHTYGSTQANIYDGNIVLTPLHYAAKNGHLKVVKQLIEAGANVNAVVSDVSPLYCAAQKNQLEVVQELIRAGADINGSSGEPPLCIAANNGYSEVVGEFIKAHVDINTCDSLGYTALMSAAKNGELQMVKQLVDLGANVNVSTTGDDHTTALEIAQQKGFQDVVDFLEKIL